MEEATVVLGHEHDETNNKKRKRGDSENDGIYLEEEDDEDEEEESSGNQQKKPLFKGLRFCIAGPLETTEVKRFEHLIKVSTEGVYLILSLAKETYLTIEKKIKIKQTHAGTIEETVTSDTTCVITTAEEARNGCNPLVSLMQLTSF